MQIWSFYVKSNKVCLKSSSFSKFWFMHFVHWTFWTLFFWIWHVAKTCLTQAFFLMIFIHWMSKMIYIFYNNFVDNFFMCINFTSQFLQSLQTKKCNLHYIHLIFWRHQLETFIKATSLEKVALASSTRWIHLTIL
jgi:hypothetical protein